MATRSKIKPLNPSADAVKVQAEVDAERKKASKAALKADREAAKPTPLKERKTAQAKVEATIGTQTTPAIHGIDFALIQRKDEEQTNYVKALREDAAALGVDPDAYVAEQLNVPKSAQGGYTGPMLALRAAAKAYVKGKNGNPHCNDAVAACLEGLTREQVVRCLVRLLNDKGVITGNPYADLNPGQQSMNLRNKLRGALKKSLIAGADVAAYVTAETKAE